MKAAGLTRLLTSGQLGIPFTHIEPLAVDGEGAFSLVYKAKCNVSGSTIALKFERPNLAVDEPLRSAAFDREASILEQLRAKSNVTQMSHSLATAEYQLKDPDYPETIRFRYFGLSFYPLTLLDLIRNHTHSFVDAMRVYRGIVKGMRQIHTEAICHRDLKPGNCFVMNGDALVGDFGTARRDQKSDNIGKGDMYKWWVWGDMRYVAPELFLGVTGFADFVRADFYSLGCVLFEICTNQILADLIDAALNKLDQANRHLACRSSSQGRRLVERIINDLETGGYLPEIGLQPPLPGRGTRELVNALFKQLCAFAPAKRLTDFDEVFRRTDIIIDRALSESRSEGS